MDKKEKDMLIDIKEIIMELRSAQAFSAHRLVSAMFFLRNQLTNPLYQKTKKNLDALYMQSIQLLQLLYADMHLEDPICTKAVYKNMLNKGYLSRDGHFVYGKSRIYDYSKGMGIDIINGNGVCRHIDAHFTDCYRMMGWESYEATVSLASFPQSPKEYSSLEKANYENIAKSKIFMAIYILRILMLTIYNIPTHVLNITSYNNKTYILDPTLDYIFKSNRYGNLSPLNSNKTIMCVAGLEESMSISEERKKLKELFSQETVSYEEAKELHEEGNRIYQSNIDSIKDFYHQNAPLYDEIVGELSKIPYVIRKIKPL